MTGLLVLTLPYQQLSGLLTQVVRRACDQARKVLYIHFDPVASLPHSPPSPTSSHHLLSVSEASKFIQDLYGKSAAASPSLDIRVVLAGFKGQSVIPVSTRYAVETVMVDSCTSDNIPFFEKRYRSYLNDKSPVIILSSDEFQKSPKITAYDEREPNNESEIKKYKNIVAGGTFDRIHHGHKILLSEGLLRCTNKFTIGIADGPLLAKKTLTELIEPIDVRIKNLKELLSDIDGNVEYYLEPIYEPLGPTGRDPDMEMIIVSQETLKGGTYVNKARAERQLNILDVEVIDLVEDINRDESEEEKVSSSSARMRLLGTLLKTPQWMSQCDKPAPFVVGLTGCSNSGKSSIAKRLHSLGATVIDCDKLGHKTYAKGTNCYNQLIKMYGPEILTEDQDINRKVLGAHVFASEDKMKQLNELVWPEIAELIRQELTLLRDAGASVVVLDAAVLLEAAWDRLCHEVWVCLLPRSEAVSRISARDSCSSEQAEQRLTRQLSDTTRLGKAHVAFCSLWDPRYTAQQVDKAWKRLDKEGLVRKPGAKM